ncbi:hypothetical protein [Clostridium akagii]|uniref:hypothetical protein n=1 Tax=Clostridium akagii TaxID=91623 RepID=UPI00056B6C81|nr:hypothetical protein [Clostridium akagii]
MTSTQIRIDGTVKRIEKINKKIARLQGLIEKKKQKIASGKEENNKYPDGTYFLEGENEWHVKDIERAKMDLVEEQKKLNEYTEKRKIEEKRDLAIPQVEAVEQFLKYWRFEAEKYYNSELLEIEKFELSISSLGYKERKNAIDNRFTQDILYLNMFGGEEQVSKIKKILNDEVDRKRIDLYTRCSAKVGLITDATGLYIGENLSLNGFVIGENGKAEIKTIFAGGYNIQCLHYRVLVK